MALYGTVWVILIAYVTKGLPLGTRSISGALVQVSPELEEGAKISGASWWPILRHIWLPLLRPSLLATWLLLFTLFLRDLSTVVLLSAPGTKVLSVAIFDYWWNGKSEYVAVLALLVLSIILVAVGVERWVGRGNVPSEGMGGKGR